MVDPLVEVSGNNGFQNDSVWNLRCVPEEDQENQQSRISPLMLSRGHGGWDRPRWTNVTLGSIRRPGVHLLAAARPNLSYRGVPCRELANIGLDQRFWKSVGL